MKTHNWLFALLSVLGTAANVIGDLHGEPIDLVGEWETVSIFRNGNELKGVLKLSGKNDDLKGEVGRNTTTEIDTASVTDGALHLEFDFEMNGRTMDCVIVAKPNGANTLVGTWTVRRPNKNKDLTGDWKAVRRAVKPEQAGELEGGIEAFLGEPVMETQQVVLHSRSQVWPNIVVALDGSVLAMYGVVLGGSELFTKNRRHVALRRSEDGGKTWGKEIVIAEPGFQGGGTIVDETNGDILAFVEDRHPPAPLTVYRSKDHGKTWEAQTGTVIRPDSKGNVPSMHMNEHGITLRHGEQRGRLLRAARWYAGKNKSSVYANMYTTAIYSDDGGLTWQTSDPFPENGTGEAAIAELSNGQIYYSSRMHWPERPQNRRRRAARSDDGGHTWANWDIVEALPDGQQGRAEGCLAGLVRLPVKGKDVLVYSNVDTYTFDRNRITVWASFDGAKTWPIKRLVYGGPSGYSSLAAGRPGTSSAGWIYIHYDGGENHDDPVGKAHLFIPPRGSLVARFNLSWLLDGQQTGDGTVPDELRK